MDENVGWSSILGDAILVQVGTEKQENVNIKG